MPPSKPSRKELLAEVERLRREAVGLNKMLEEFRLFADQSASMIFLLDLEAGHMVYANKRFEELLGYAHEELTAPGFDFFAMVAPDSVEKVRRSHDFHRRGEEHLPFEFAMLAQGGQRVEVLLNSRLVAHDGHHAVLGILTDITGLVESAATLRMAKEELERQNIELRALDRIKDGFIRDVSHELKTPVAKQAMQLELLRLQLGATCTGPVAKTIGVLEETVRRQQRVIRNMLDLARLESGRRIFRLGPVRVDEVLARVIEDYRPMLEAKGFSVTLRAEPLTATADAEMLWHVVSNLVNNAVKFTRREEERRLDLAAAAAGDRAVVRITDNGIGLTPQELSRVFDRFFQASAAIEGSGVGLSLCGSIMEGMNGTIQLESPGPGRGAVATLTLPL